MPMVRSEEADCSGWHRGSRSYLSQLLADSCGDVAVIDFDLSNVGYSLHAQQ
jgi:hypothetical protein